MTLEESLIVACQRKEGESWRASTEREKGIFGEEEGESLIICAL